MGCVAGFHIENSGSSQYRFHSNWSWDIWWKPSVDFLDWRWF